MNTKRVLATIVALCILLAGFASVSTINLQAENLTEPATVYNSEVFVFRSETREQDYRIYVALPQNYFLFNKPAAYPVIYSMDANWNFSSDASSVMHLMAGNESTLWLQDELVDMIVVGIGYPTDNNAELDALRSIDMTPDKQAADFLDFLKIELIPYIDENYRTNPEDRAIAGNSLGGNFALYAMFNATDTFQHYLSLSPALSYPHDDPDLRLMFDIEQAFASENDTLPVDLFISIGEIEPEFSKGYHLNAVTNVVEFYDTLESRDYEGLDMEMMIIDDLGHWGSYPVAFTYGLVKAFD